MRAPLKPTLEPLSIHIRRLGAVVLTVVLTAIAMGLFLDVVASDGFDALDAVRVVLLAATTGWLAWGACTAVLGLIFPMEPRGLPDGWDGPQQRVAVLMPVYNEDASAVFANVLAMYEEIQASGHGDAFDFHILSDSTNEARAEEERRLYRDVLTRFGAGNRIFYRRRTENTGRKAGNIKSFVTASGGAYGAMLVLDADSVMSAETILEMVRRMDADPKLGLLQTLPVVTGQSSLFGRALQFSAALYAPIFTRGIAALQGRQGPFWGHNALIRIEAFAGSCGLPTLPGKPPFGGDVLSHDFVEAALLARNGWKVRVDPDLGGSYEEAPANLLEYAKRDRRWCQGNLQHSKIIGTPGMPYWSRTSLIQGILSYLASPMWALFLIASLMAVIVAPAPVYFPIEGSGQPVFPQPERNKAIILVVGIVALLVLPKALIVWRGLVQENLRPFGGKAAMASSAVIELVLSSIVAPINMMFQTRSVLQVLSGRDSGWPAANRSDGSVGLWTGLKATWWMMLTGIAAMTVAWFFAPKLLIWLWPVTVPLILAPFVISLTATPAIGRAAARGRVLLTPAETEPVPVLSRARALHQVFAGPGPLAVDDENGARARVMEETAA